MYIAGQMFDINMKKIKNVRLRINQNGKVFAKSDKNILKLKLISVIRKKTKKLKNNVQK